MKSRAIPMLLFLTVGVATCLHAASSPPVSIILDTDIGTDIDDAFALALALASPEIDLRGVTTVSADAYTRALIACRFLDAVGRPQIPVAAGRPRRDTPQLDGQFQYGLRPTRKRPLQKSAVEFLYEQIEASPGAITLVPVADLTNIAELITKHPESKPWIKRIVLMGGAIRVGYTGKPPAVREWNIRSDVKAAQIVFRSGIPLLVAPVDATASLKLIEPLQRRIFETDTPLCWHLNALYDLWGKPTPTLFDPVAVTLAFDESFCTIENLRIEVDDEGYTREVAGPPNCRVATAIRSDAYLRWYVDRVTQFVSASRALSRESSGPANISQLVPRGPMPARVHVVEDYETDIERRWWPAGRLVTEETPPGSMRACRAVLCRDFDERMDNQNTIYKAVVFNPVPGPPMGKNTRLSFRYRLSGTDTLRVQIYSLSRNYHRYLTLTGLPQGEWQSATVDMTDARRPDGTGGPLAADERIDDIQFYVDREADLTIDDIVLHEAAPSDESHPFPRRIIFTGWFDTGQQGQEWPGDFEIVAHEKPRTWRAARSVPSRETGGPWIRVHLRGLRTLSDQTCLRFCYRLIGGRSLRIVLANSGTHERFETVMSDVLSGEWTETTVRFQIPPKPNTKPRQADEIRFIIDRDAELFLDDLLLFEPGA